MYNKAGGVSWSQLEDLGSQQSKVAAIWEKEAVLARFCTYWSMVQKKETAHTHCQHSHLDLKEALPSL